MNKVPISQTKNPNYNKNYNHIELLTLLNSIQKNFIYNTLNQSQQEIFNLLLIKILDFTNSEYGFVGEITYQANNKIAPKLLAVIDVSLGGGLDSFYSVNQLYGKDFSNSTALFDYVLKTQKPIIANSPADDFRIGDLKQGHPPINNFLGIPLLISNHLIGVLGLANSPDKYSQELLDFLEPLIATLTSMLQAYQNANNYQKSQQDLITREAQLSAIVNTAVDTIITINENGIIKMANPALEKMFGYTIDEVLEQNIKMLMPEPYCSNHDGYLRNYFKTGIRKVIGIGREALGKHKSGNTFPIALAISEWHVNQSKMFTGIIHDLTLTKQAEKEIIEMAETKSQFAAMVSHELRTPMVPISEGIDLLESSKDLNEEQEELLEIIKRNIKRLSNLINDTLDFGKLEANKMKFYFKPHLINDIIKDIVEILNFQAQLKNIEIQLEPCQEHSKIICDRSKIEQVIMNLLSNAIKFSEQGPIIVGTKYVNSFIKVFVKDRGQGIEKADQKRLFQPFEQIHNVEKGKPKGTGLGLAISKRIIDHHHGEIGFESELGYGTTFFFTLPLPKIEERETN